MSVKQNHNGYVVYSVQDPISLEVRYIGITKNLDKRMREHKHSAKKGLNRHFYHWYRKLMNDNKQPVFSIVDYCKDYTEACASERSFIQKYKSIGSNLCNHTSGGEGLSNPSEITVAKIKEKRKHQVFTEETKNKMRLSKLGKKRGPMPEAVREKIRIANTGFCHSQESRLKMSMQRKGKLLGKRVEVQDER